MAYTITGSGLTVYAKDTGVTKFGNIYSNGSSNTIYLIPYVGASPTTGTNYIYGVGAYNLLNYMSSPGPVILNMGKGVATNGYGGTDYFTGITGAQLSSFSDLVQGSIASEIFDTRAGNDTVYGGGGYDIVSFGAQSTDYQISYDLPKDLWTVVFGSDIKKLYQIDTLQFKDKVFVASKPVTLTNGNELTFAGSWSPFEAVLVSKSGSILSPFHSLISLDNSGFYGLVITGWSFAGFDRDRKSPANVSISLLTPSKNGSLQVNTQKYISDPTTWGGGSVVVADFNKDGMSDIFLAPYNETPLVAKPSTVFISNTQGSYNKVILDDSVIAHDASLFFIDGNPHVVASTYGGNAAPVYKYTNGKFSITDVNIQIQISESGVEHYGGSSTVIGNFGIDNALELVRGDTLTYTSTSWDKVTGSNIKVFGFSAPNNISSQPIQVIPSYLANLPEYKNFKSYLGTGITHIYRVWSDDLNHDGSLDVLAGEAFYLESTNFPTALQVLINKGDGTFIDKTAILNPDLPHTVNELDYTPSFIDLDQSGIDTILMAGLPGSPERQSNFVLLNDGTGRLYIGLHDEFVGLTSSVYEFLQKQFAGKSGYMFPTYSSTTEIPTYIGIPQPDGSINFVAQVSTFFTLANELLTQIQFVNVPLSYNPSTDYVKDTFVTDRNNSTLIRTWAGNDIFKDKNANSSPAFINGGLGIDTSVYLGAAKDYLMKSLGNSSFEIKLTSGPSVVPKVSDTLTSIERLKFSDKSIALDLDGNTGTTAKILGAVFGKESVSNKSYVGIGLNLLDTGWSYDNLAALALDAAGAKTNDQIVSLLWTNVIGTKPTAADKQPFIALLENGMTAGALAHLAADTSFNTININLVGLAQTGIEYIPVS